MSGATGIPPSGSTSDFVHVTLTEGQPAPPEQAAGGPPHAAAAPAEPEIQPATHQAGPAPAAATAGSSGSGGGGGEGIAGLLGSIWAGGAGAAGPEASAGPGAGGPAGGEDPMKEIEDAAARVADQARSAARVASVKLKEGAAEAKESLSALAAGFSSWFAGLEPGNQFALPGVSSQSKHQDYAAISEALGLDAGEAILESFKCQLLQTYACTNNPFTPPRQVPFAGQLHITSQRVCFVVEGEKGAVDPVKLDLRAIKRVSKEPAVAAEGLPERLVLALSENGGQSLVLARFALKELEMDSALALLEHLAAAE